MHQHTHLGITPTQRGRITLILTVLFIATYLIPFTSKTAGATYFTFVSDTISNSSPGANANHLIAWTSATAAAAGLTIKIGFDPTADLFNLTSLVAGDISATGMTVVANLGACAAAGDEVYPTIDSTAPDENVTLTVCPTDSVGAGAKTVTMGNNHITNPATPGSYGISIEGTQVDNGFTRVAIIANVQMTARIDTLLTFTITGIGVGQAINGAVTSTTTTSTAILWGTLLPNTPVVAGQELVVITNAANGFTVTVRENQNLTSGLADIDTFIDGAETAAPVVWVAPNVISGNEDTYGHIGLTSNDSDEGAGEFVGQKYAGNFLSAPRAIFSHTGPANGLVQDSGIARVAYKIEISGTQEAAENYTNQLIYVCTPIF